MAAEDQRIASFAREQAQREQERRAAQSAQNAERERLQQEVGRHLSHVDAISQFSNVFISFVCICITMGKNIK